MNSILCILLISTLFSLILLAGCCASSGPTAQPHSNSTLSSNANAQAPTQTPSPSPTPRSITTSTKTLMPNKEIPTQWYLTTSVADQSSNDTGFVEGSARNITEPDGTGTNNRCSLYLSRYTTIENAASAYNQSVNDIQEQRGYSEMDTSGIAADCFGYVRDVGMGYNQDEISCHKFNMAYRVKCTGWAVDQNDLVTIIQAMTTNIENG